MDRVIVTGGSGFIGRNTIQALIASGYDVTAWSRSEKTTQFWQQQGVRAQTGDLAEIGSAEYAQNRTSTIIHLAGIVAPNSRDETFAVNVDKTRQIVERLSRWQTPPRFIFVSSLAASGPCVDGVPRKESDPCNPRSIYGQSKAAAEAMLTEYADRVPISIVRPPGVFGPWDRNLLTLFQSVSWKLNLVGISKQFRYSFVHVDDLAAGLIAVMKSGRTLVSRTLVSGADKDATGIYFVSDPQSVTFVELANMIADSLAVRAPLHLTVPSPICHVVANVSQWYGQLRKQPTYLNRDKMREAVAGSWVCDPSRAADELGFSVAKSLSNRIIDTAHWYRQQNWIAK